MRLLVRAMIQRDLSGLDAMAGAVVGAETDAATSPLPATPRQAAGDAILNVENLELRDAEGVVQLDHVSLSVRQGEILGIAGVEGNGQSELAAVLSGMTVPSAGRYRVGADDLFSRTPKAITRAGVGVVPEDRHRVGCVPSMPLGENLCLDRLVRFRRFGLLDRGALLARATELMTSFDVRAPDANVRFERLSGGNQQKAVLARELTLPDLRVLIAAQPTRGLDVGAVEAIYGHIRRACERGLAVLLISSELDELLAVCNRIAVMYRGRIMGECDAVPEARTRIGAWMAGHPA
jgi:simple sugar transport system ATP-binding protein